MTAVVREQDHDGVVVQLEPLEGVQQAPDALVDAGHHRGVPRAPRELLRIEGRFALGQPGAVLLDQQRLALHRRVHGEV